MTSSVSVFGSPLGGIVCKCRLCCKTRNVAPVGVIEPGTLYARVQKFVNEHKKCVPAPAKKQPARIPQGDIRDRTRHLSGPSWKEMSKRDWKIAKAAGRVW